VKLGRQALVLGADHRRCGLASELLAHRIVEVVPQRQLIGGGVHRALIVLANSMLHLWVNTNLHVGCAIYYGDSGVLEAVDHVRALAGRFNVRELVFDPWRFAQAALELEREGLLVVAFPQHDARMIPASARLHSAIVEKRITLPDHPELARHASEAIARHSRRGWRIDKPNPRANIDAIIALAMAVERAEFQPAPVKLIGWL
jgi:hypothetical protein